MKLYGDQSASIIPQSGAIGTALITVTVNDGQSQNNTFSRSFSVRVSDRPTLSLIADQVSAEDAVIGPLPFTVSDRDTAAEGLVVSASSRSVGRKFLRLFEHVA